MQDRVPLYPGRIKLLPVAGQENTFDMVRADQPTQEGTPLNKDALLKDATAALYGLDAGAVPDDVLALLKTMVDNAQDSANEKAKIEVGSYVGTGSAKVTLTFSGTPKIVVISGMASGGSSTVTAVLIHGIASVYASGHSGGTSAILIALQGISWENKSVSWTNGNKDYGANITGKTYLYSAFI